MDRQNQEEQNSRRNPGKERLDRTGEKMKMQDDPLIESKYEMTNGSKNNELNNRLDQIQNEIKECGKRLQQIQKDQRLQTDKYSEHYLQLEHERTQLKKRVIDLDFQHKMQIVNQMRQSRRKQSEQKQKVIRQAELLRQQRKRQVDQRFNKMRGQKRQQEQQQDVAQKQATEQNGSKINQTNAQNQLQRSRRKLRIAQIQSQLAESRLRRSRVASLSAQLDHLRATYTYPYWHERDYVYPYSLYSDRYSYSSLYPYTSYPYLGTYSYISPLSYRWWL